jgi:hypothetical protein
MQVIAVKHAHINAMFAEVQTHQAAANSRLSQLSQQLQSLRSGRVSRAAKGSAAAAVSSRAVSSDDTAAW